MSLKQKGPGAFTIPCFIGNASFKKALCNLGASISVVVTHFWVPTNKYIIIIIIIIIN